MLKERLVILRTNKGLSQYELAKVLSLSRGQISNYELGTRQPDYETLAKIADYFNVSTDYLLGRTDDPTPSSSSKSVLPKGFENFIRIMKSQRGAVTSENALLILTEMAQLYAVSKGVPPSVIADQLSRVNEIPDKEKTRLVDEIDGVLQDESNAASELAKEIESLPERERQAMEAMLEVLKNKSGDAAAQES